MEPVVRGGAGWRDRPVTHLRHPSGIHYSALFGFAAAASTLAVVIVTLELQDWGGWSGFVLLIVPSLAALALRRRSLVVSLYLAQMAVYYGLTALILGEDSPPGVLAAVLVWVLGVVVGTLVCRRPRVSAPTVREWTPPRWPHFALTAGLILVQASLVVSGGAGYGAQLTLGLSTPVGALGILSTAAPVVVVLLLVTSLATQRFVSVAMVLALLEAIVSSLSGFRSAAVVFIITAAVAVALTLPASSPWRHPRRMAIVGAVLAVVAVGGFIVGANIKQTAAAQLSLLSSGSQLFGFDQAIPTVAARLDQNPPLAKAVAVQNDPSVEEAVSWTTQLQAFVPRILVPDKPIVDYPQRVSVVVYGYLYGHTSSSISTIGDTLVNFKVPGIIVAPILLGLVATLAERRVRRGVGLRSVIIAVGLSYVITAGQESPLILSVVGVTRNLLVAAVLWVACQVLLPGKPRKGSLTVL